MTRLSATRPVLACVLSLECVLSFGELQVAVECVLSFGELQVAVGFVVALISNTLATH